MSFFSLIVQNVLNVIFFEINIIRYTHVCVRWSTFIQCIYRENRQFSTYWKERSAKIYNPKTKSIRMIPIYRIYYRGPGSSLSAEWLSANSSEKKSLFICNCNIRLRIWDDRTEDVFTLGSYFRYWSSPKPEGEIENINKIIYRFGIMGRSNTVKGQINKIDWRKVTIVCHCVIFKNYNWKMQVCLV